MKNITIDEFKNISMKLNELLVEVKQKRDTPQVKVPPKLFTYNGNPITNSDLKDIHNTPGFNPEYLEAPIYNDNEIPEDSFHWKKEEHDEHFSSHLRSVKVSKDDEQIEYELMIIFISWLFSNWFLMSFHGENGILYTCAEQAFIHCKAKCTECYRDDSPETKKWNDKIAELVLQCRCPMLMQSLGRMLLLNIILWDKDYSSSILANCIFQKFIQNDYLWKLMKFLIANKIGIIEGTGDRNYGMGKKFDLKESLDKTKMPGSCKLTDIFISVMGKCDAYFKEHAPVIDDVHDSDGIDRDESRKRCNCDDEYDAEPMKRSISVCHDELVQRSLSQC